MPPAPLPNRTPQRPMSVVLVDPDEQARMTLATLLKESALPQEMSFSEVGSLADALKLFHKNHPDLMLISTVQLPTLGEEIAAHVRANEGNRHTGLIFISGQEQDDATLSVHCLEMGADDFLRGGATAAEMLARVRAVLRLKAMTDQLRSANHKLRILALTDDLTGLANMRSFNQKYNELLRSCRKGRCGLGVIMIDLDHFKAVNDTTNHLVGSFVIAAVGQVIKQLDLSSADVAARYGGDEFIIALAADSCEKLELKADELRVAVREAVFERYEFTVKITASIGIAFVERGFRGKAEDVIKAADKMLYESKESGRDQVRATVLACPSLLSKAS